MFKQYQCLCLTLIILICIPIPTVAGVKVEWQTDALWSDHNSETDSQFLWETGFRTIGDWALGEDWAFILRNKIYTNNDTEEWNGILERCYFQYQYQSLRFNLGRQAVNWGVGWLFRPTDVITPRTVYNQEETRPGVDLAVFYWATSPLTATELLAGEDLGAGRTECRIGETNLRFSGISLPTGEKLVGVDIQGGLANFYGEAVFSWDERYSKGKPAMVVGWKKYFANGSLLYLEYFRNDGGSTQGYTGKNYLGAGMDIPWDQLTSFNLAEIANLDDGGVSLTGSVQMQLTDNFDLNGGLTYLIGDEDTEFRKSGQDSRRVVNFQIKYYF